PTYLALLPADQKLSLQTICCAGEACPVDLAQRWSQGRRFLNGYGPTEATIAGSYYRVDGLAEDARSVPIGKANANAQLYLLDPHLQPVPVGAAGELYIGGVGVTRGYLNQPHLTAEKFVPDPFGKEPGARLYRTGDLCRYLPDGNLEFVARVDEQVKIRGFRIELEEIERLLSQHPQVGQSVVMVREEVPGEKRIVAYVTPAQKSSLELWPSVAEFYIYDDLLYYAMTHDERRNQAYRVALERTVKDRVVVEIGPGKDAILSRLCIEAGARKVYTIELLEETYLKAKACLEELGLTDRIHLIHGDARQVELPELGDVCVSEIVGGIGGSEGAALLINDVRRLLKPGGRMIPERSVTRIAGVSLPDDILSHPTFLRGTEPYVEQIFEQVGYPFDLRVCLKGLDYSDLLTGTDVFEDLDFTRPIPLETDHEITLNITQDGRLDGLIVWLTLFTEGSESIDILSHEHCWLPIYLPVFNPGVSVSAGDRLEAVIRRRLCENGMNPDFHIEGRLYRASGESVEVAYSSWHNQRVYRHNAFYQRLFSESGGIARQSAPAALTGEALRSWLQKQLPDYMVPSVFMKLETMPLTPNGKIDRKALPVPEIVQTENDDAYEAPQTSTEETLARIWREVLRLKRVGIRDNFFELGGDSILSIQIIARANAAGLKLTPMQVFQHQTIAELAAVAGTGISVEGDQGSISGAIPLTPIQHWFLEQESEEPHHYNQSRLLQLDPSVRAEQAQVVMEALVAHHDALRLRFERTGDGWRQINAPEELNPFFTEVDFSSVAEADRSATITEFCSQLQASLDLQNGPLLRAGYIHLGEGVPARLMLAIHHLGVDGVSWRVLLEDLRTGLEQ
ncbi:MAG TPA: condensation domain-containing protein, partial [Chthonomonadaceae bacterium]|nr:condensation domain-containing protein [Chthonomonadaceae bacterium]